MPAFGDSLTEEQVIGYLRGFCKKKGWPRAELNLPRGIVTEKAYLEDETVVTTAINVTGAPGVSNEIVHEQRFGQKNQIEVSVPVDFVHPKPGLWYGGFGDFGLALKRVVYANNDSGTILSVFGEAIFPTRNRANGLGSGVMTFEEFAAFGQILPWNTFIQLQGGADLPVDTKQAPQSTFFARRWARISGRITGSGAGGRRCWNCWARAIWLTGPRLIWT